MGKGQRFTEEFRVEAVSSDSVIRRAYRLFLFHRALLQKL